MTRLPLSPLVAGTVRLEAGAARYLSRVLRLRSGDAIEVFDPKAGVSATAVVRVDGEQVELEIGETVAAARRAPWSSCRATRRATSSPTSSATRRRSAPRW